MRNSPAVHIALGLFLAPGVGVAQADKEAELEKQLAAESAELKKSIEEHFDLTKGISDVCPIHKVTMPAKTVPISYGTPSVGILELIKRDFPFSQESIWGGCLSTDEPLWPKNGKAYVCPDCVKGFKKFIDDAFAKASAVKAKK